MSATLHDPDDLRRRLGTGAITKLQIPPEMMSEDDGRRLFVFNQVATPSTRLEAPKEVLAPLRELLSAAGKSVWLCSSRVEAQRWAGWIRDHFKSLGGFQPPIWELSQTGDELEDFRTATAGHLLIAGRFEGMDFPDDVCQLVVFPSLPRATGLLEGFVTQQLRDAGFQKLRLLERIKQGVGRCTRGKNDYAVYYFLDPRFYGEMESNDFSRLVSERTRRQIEVDLQLTETGMGEVVPFAMKFLKGQFEEFDKREEEVEPIPLRVRQMPAPTPDTVDDEVEGWRAMFEKRDFTRASTRFETVGQLMTDAERENRAFWKYTEAFAEFLRARLDDTPGSLERSISLLKWAIKEGGSSSWFNRLVKATNRLTGETTTVPSTDLAPVFDRWDVFVEKYPYHKGRFLKWQAALKSQLDGSHNQVSEALETLGVLLGFASSRPTGNAAPDVLWRDPDYALTIEAKTEAERDFVSRTDVNQADGQRRAAIKDTDLPDAKVDGLIISSMSKVDAEAAKAVGRIRILPLELVEDLRGRLESLMRDYWRTWVREDASARLKARETALRRLPKPGWLSRVIQGALEPVIDAERLLKEWP